MSPPRPVVTAVGRRVAFQLECDKRTAEDVVSFVFDALTTEDITKLAEWRGLRTIPSA